ncbi:hypothetical protein PMAYCL1PPCAC_32857, partial [Pristionchus mayeri]
MIYPDIAFLIYAVYIPLIILIYFLELIVIVWHRRQYSSSFYHIFSVVAVVDILACLAGSFLHRLPMYSIVNGFYEHLLGNRTWLPPLNMFIAFPLNRSRLCYYLNCVSQYLGVLMAANRFTAIFMPNYHDKVTCYIWRYFLPIFLLICLLISVIPVWFLI